MFPLVFFFQKFLLKIRGNFPLNEKIFNFTLRKHMLAPPPALPLFVEKRKKLSKKKKKH